MNKRRIFWTAGLLFAGGLVAFRLLWSNHLDRDNSFPGPITEKEVADAAKKWEVELPTPPAVAVPMAIDLHHPVRLAIGSLGMTSDEQNRSLGDLVLADLSGAQGLDLVERQSLDAVLRELSLSLSGLVRAKDAVHAGKLLKADWFLLGTESKINGTNSMVLIRLVDARTGILRDVQVVPASETTMQMAADIAAFVRQSRQNTTKPKLMNFLAIGGFEDLSLNNRLVDFPNQLRSYLTVAYQKSGVTLLEREAADALFHEVCLDLAGLTDEGSTNARQPMQSAYWLVDGSYQLLENSGSEVEVALDVSRMFGPWSQPQSIFHGKPDEALFQQIKVAIDARLKDTKPLVLPTRLTEVRAQMDIGKKLAQLSDAMPGPFEQAQEETGLTDAGSIQDLDEQELGRLRHNTEQAIHAFETVMLLEPTNREAKMYLAACFRKQTIGRVDEARDIYRGIIEAPLQDKWTGLAERALVNSFYWSGADEKARWFAAAGQHDTNSAADEFFRQNTEEAAKDAFIENGSGDATELAEKRLLEEIRSSKNAMEGKIATFYSGYGLYDFQDAFRDKATAARKMADFLPKMESEFPDLSPLLAAQVLEFQTDTNSPVVEEFRNALDRCIKHPAEIARLHDFWFNARYSAFKWLYEHKYYSDALNTMEGFRLAAEKDKEIHFNYEDQIALAYAYKGASRWSNALAIFQSFTNRPLLMTTEEPWGCTCTPVQTCQEANECREKLGLPMIHDPREFTGSGTCLQMEPFSDFTRDTTFVTDIDGLWLGSGNRLYHLDWNLKTKFSVSLPKDISTPIYAICLTSSNIWIATGGDGLIEFDKKNHLCRRFTVEDGLMMNAISCLSLAEDKLWIGYGYKYDYDRGGARLPPGGGIGCLDLLSNHFISFQPSLADGSEAQKNLSGNLVMESPSKPTRRAVRAIAADANGVVWFVDEETSVRRFQSKQDIWDAALTGGDCLAINATKLFVGQSWYQPDGSYSPGPGPLGVSVLDFQNSQWTSLDNVEGLPSGAVSAITMDGDDLWVGGLGYVALIDAKQKKILKFAYIAAQSVDKIQIGGGYVWAQYNGWLHRVSPAAQ